MSGSDAALELTALRAARLHTVHMTRRTSVQLVAAKCSSATLCTLKSERSGKNEASVPLLQENTRF